MKIRDLLAQGRPVISFEFFPPRTTEAEGQLRKALSRLQALQPSFVSVTYGAGGSTRDRTVDLVAHIKNDLGVEAMAHLTCVGSTRDEIRQVLRRLESRNIENVLALRGDPPEGQEQFVRPEGGFGYASELTAFVQQEFSFCVGGACYPEAHVECRDLDQDIAHLRQKVEAGAEFLVSQLFFDPELYFRFVEKARAAGIQVPITPGIMPVTNVSQVERFTSMCGASIPARLKQDLDRVRDDPTQVREVGVTHATEQCAALLRGGAPGIHFYTLNRSPATRAIFTRLQEQGLL